MLHRQRMGQTVSPASLTAEQVRELNDKLSHMRHEINNQLSLLVAAMDLIRFRPEMRDKMMETMAQQPAKIQEEIARFSSDFEAAMGLQRGGETGEILRRNLSGS
jgi:hypothetical protein